MNESELQVIRNAIDVLCKLLPADERAQTNVPGRPCPVATFVRRFLLREPKSCMGSIELWRFYKEVSDVGEAEPLSREAFLRRLPAAMWTVYGVRKCHSIESAGHQVRGFKGIVVNEYAS